MLGLCESLYIKLIFSHNGKETCPLISKSGAGYIVRPQIITGYLQGDAYSVLYYFSYALVLGLDTLASLKRKENEAQEPDTKKPRSDEKLPKSDDKSSRSKDR